MFGAARDLPFPADMEWPPVWTVVACAAFVPYVGEVIFQLFLQGRFLAALPARTRDALPPHPRHPFLAFLGSLRFTLAFWRYVRNDDLDDPGEVRALKRKMRASLRREIVWGILGVGTLVALVACGWRPG